MSKEAVIEVRENAKKRKNEYFVKGFDVTESVEFLLAEVEKDYEFKKQVELQCGLCVCNDFLDKQAEKYRKQITDLETKLAESEKEKKHLKDWLDDVLLTSIDHESFNAMQEEYEKENAEIKQQLAEKEKAHMEAMQNALNDFLKLRQELNQDKIDFAVAELEKVKSLIIEKYRFDVEESDFAVAYEDDIDEIFNQQIKAIKEKK